MLTSDNIFSFLCIYLLIINLTGFILMGMDKRRAKKDKWRIPEKTLFLTAILGGSIGSIAGMHILRHKTKHTTFVIGMPCILVIQIALVIFILCRPTGF